MFSSCGSDDQVNGERFVDVNGQIIPLIHLDLAPDSATTIGWKDMFESVEMIPLETAEDCMIMNYQTTFTDHSLILSTQIGMGDPCKVYEFDLEGNFIGEIGGTGKGPGEHAGYFMEDATYYPAEKLIKVQFNGIFPHVQLFDIDRKYIEDVSCPIELVQDIARLEEDLYVVVGSLSGRPEFKRDSASLFWFNSSKEIVKMLPRSDYPPANKSGYTPYAGHSSLYQYEDTWHFHNPVDDTVYQIDRLDLKPIAIIVHGDKFAPVNKIIDTQQLLDTYTTQIVGEREEYWILEKSVVTMVKFNEYRPGQWGGEYNANYFNLVVDKNDGVVHNVRLIDDLLGIVPDERAGNNIQYDPFGKTYKIYQALDVIEWIDKGFDEGTIAEESLEKVNALRKQINEESNPILFLFNERKKYRL